MLVEQRQRNEWKKVERALNEQDGDVKLMVVHINLCIIIIRESMRHRDNVRQRSKIYAFQMREIAV